MGKKTSPPIETKYFYDITSDFVAEIKGLLDTADSKRLKKVVLKLHAADCAKLIEQFETEDQEALVGLLAHDLDVEVFTHLPESLRTLLLPLLGVKAISSALLELDSDDAVLLLGDLDPEQQRQILKKLSTKDRTLLQESLTFPEDTAGRLMQREVVCVPTSWTVKQVIAFIKADKHLPSLFYNIFVVDVQDRVVGKVSLSALLKANHLTHMSTLMETNTHAISPTRNQEDVARVFQHYGLTSAPVINDKRQVIGMITVDDIVQVIEEEAEQDILYMAGMSSSDFGLGYFETFAKRAPWLFATMLNGILTSFIICQFERSLSAVTALSFFLPLPAMMGGNVGTQVVTVIVRAVSTRDLLPHNALKALRKEAGVGFLNGIMFSSLLGIFSVFFTGGQWLIGLIVFGSLMWNIVWAAVAGCLLPLMLSRAGMDPAISAGPIVTVTTDILGYAVYLLFATAWLL